MREARILVTREASSREMFFARRASCNFLPSASIGTAGSDGGVEIDENLARLGAFAGAQYAALLENINDPGGPGIAETEPALQERSGGALLLADDFETFLDQLFVFVGHVLVRGGGGRFHSL